MQSKLFMEPSEIVQDRFTRCLKRLVNADAMAMEFTHKWKNVKTPGGRVIPAITASGRRTKETDCSGVPAPYPTPDHHRHGEIQDEAKLLNRIRQAASNGADKRQANLEDVAMLFPLATPTTRDWPDGKASEETMNANSRPLNEQAVMLMDWGTPQASWSEAGARSRSGDRKDELLTPGLVSDWGTPTAHERTFAPRQVDHGIQLANQVHGMIIASSPVKTGNSVVLAGEFSRWLQGFPEAWDKASPNYDEWSRVQELIESDD